MKTVKTILLFGIMAATIIGCAGAPAQKKNVPDFVLNPPKATDAIYGIGFGTPKSNLQQAIDEAALNAQNDIARQLEIQIDSSMTQYFQEAGVDGNKQTIEFTENIKRGIVSKMLKGATREQMEIMDDNGVWALYVWSTNALSQAFTEVVQEFQRNEDAAFAEFKADEALKLLDHQIQNKPTQATGQ